eukprot:10139363-Alexandrium_andersonii.AAC.1
MDVGDAGSSTPGAGGPTLHVKSRARLRCERMQGEERARELQVGSAFGPAIGARIVPLLRPSPSPTLRLCDLRPASPSWQQESVHACLYVHRHSMTRQPRLHNSTSWGAGRPDPPR